MSETSETILEPTESTNTGSYDILKNWTEITQPKRMKFERETLSESYGKFFLEPLEPGFGITIGPVCVHIGISNLVTERVRRGSNHYIRKSLSDDGSCGEDISIVHCRLYGR